MRIAIADDEPDARRHLLRIVNDMGHVGAEFEKSARLAQALLRDTFDLVLLDWAMPGRSGLEVLHWMRATLENAPAVIMMTARSAKRDVSDALTAGADDYITKPEEDHVVAARIAAVLRRAAPSPGMERHACFGPFRLDRVNQTIATKDAEIALTSKEFELADLLFRNHDRTLSRAYIMELIWRTSASLTTRTLDMHVSRLRTKLGLNSTTGFRIATVFGYGYRLERVSEGND